MVGAGPFISGTSVPESSIVIAQCNTGGITGRGGNHRLKIGIVEGVNLRPQSGVGTRNSNASLMCLHTEAHRQFVVGLESFPMPVIGNVAIEAVIRRKAVDHVLLMVVGGKAQTLLWSPVHGLVSVKPVLWILREGVAKPGIADVTV